MSAVRNLPARPSLDSLRNQAKRLARDVAAGDAKALARVHVQLPRAHRPLSNRDAQLVVAREYGFAGWSALTEEVHRRVGSGIDWAASEARAAIHNADHGRLGQLLAEYPALTSWHDDNDQALLDATTSYAMDCSDPVRERTYTRPIAAEMLIDAGAVVNETTWMHAIKSGARGLLHLFDRKDALPRTLPVLAALADEAGVRAGLTTSRETGTDLTAASEPGDINLAFLIACRFQHSDIALLLLERLIGLNVEFGQRIDRWGNRQEFVAFLASQPGILWQDAEMTSWQTFVVLQLASVRDRNDLPAFRNWLNNEPWILESAFISVQGTLMLPACYQKHREAFIVALLERDPAILHADTPPQSSHIVQALSYGNAHLIPLLARIWPLPDDLPHAAGVGNGEAVARWFDEDGRPMLGSLGNHYPASDPLFPRADLHWGSPTVQQTLDIALAWAVLNLHFDIARFLLAHGANINTDWATHEPASILHEAAIQGNAEAVQFLVDNDADLAMTDYRYRSTAEGWARYGSQDEAMAERLAKARLKREGRAS